ncbi:MAG TPA: hypothetical protein PLP08_18905, partial [Plasticicumulans sp.]|uniref:hypothetical protein n=1 Tax=Plasticicumulans sp. TaxID=2307179 RepID=UPI002C45A309
MDVNGSSALLLASAAAFAGEAEGVQWNAAGNCLRLADAVDRGDRRGPCDQVHLGGSTRAASCRALDRRRWLIEEPSHRRDRRAV